MSYTPTKAGELLHRITIVRRITGPQNETGETQPTNYTTQTKWAKIETPSAEERYRAAEVYENVSHVVTMRYTPDLTTADQLQFRGRTFDIASLINPEQLDLELVAMCREAVAAD